VVQRGVQEGEGLQEIEKVGDTEVFPVPPRVRLNGSGQGVEGKAVTTVNTSKNILVAAVAMELQLGNFNFSVQL